MKMILASSSPRRVELLTSAGFKFRVVSPEADETVLPGESPKAMVKRLARVKGRAVLRDLPARQREGSIVISADTTVVAPNGKRILGKPDDARDAIQMLSELSGQVHTVLTAYCILVFSRGHVDELIRVVSSRVRIRELSPDFIRQYVASGEPMDKAGAYAAQGMGMCFIDEIRGSYTNVVGLPMSQLLTDLEAFFEIVPPPSRRKSSPSKSRKR